MGAVTMGAGMFVKGVMTVRKAWLARALRSLSLTTFCSSHTPPDRGAPAFSIQQALLAGKSADMGIKAIESLDEFLTGCASLVFGMVRVSKPLVMAPMLTRSLGAGPVRAVHQQDAHRGPGG